jgi:hypothetical protein
MFLRELYSPRVKFVICEGGNLVIGDVEANKIDTSQRASVVPILDNALSAINSAYAAAHGGKGIWNPKLLASKKFLAGSSFHFFDRTGISDEIFAQVKKTVGDIDTMIDANKRDDIVAWLSSLGPGAAIGPARFVGFDDKDPTQVLTLWSFPDIVIQNDAGEQFPINIQIDLEMKEYEDDGPSEWSRFSTSSSWEDLNAGIKGVFHKYLIQSMTGLTAQDFMLRKLVGRGKARAPQDIPTRDNMYSFAIKSKEGGGLRPKYDPVIDPKTGAQEVVDGLPVFEPRATTGYEKNLGKIFQTIFGSRMKPKQLNAEKEKFWSFVGILDLIKNYLEPEEQSQVVDNFLEKLFGPSAQGLYASDKQKDNDEKSAAVVKMFELLGVRPPENLQQMKQDYYAAYKIREHTSINEAEAPNYKRQGIKHIYNPGSSTEISDKDFLVLVRKIKQDLGGKLKGAKVNLKVDGAGIRFGKDESGRPFMMTSRADRPLYADDIGSFAAFNKDRGEEFQARGAKYDRALDTIVNSDFIKALPDDTIVQAEMLYNEMAEKTAGGLKFVNIPYDPRKLGGKMTLVPFMVKVYSTGETHPDEESVLATLNDQSNKDIKIMSNTLPTKDIDVNEIIDPAVNLAPDLEATLAPRTKDTPEKQQAREIIAGVKKEFSDFIINNPNISNKDQLGPNIEGLVIELPGLPPVKVTSQEMKSAMAAKKAPPPGSENQPTKTAVVGLGSFVGHRGHQQLFQFVKDEAEAQGGDPFMFISQAVGVDDPIPGDIKLATWQKLYPDQQNVFSLVADQPDGSRGSLIKKVEHELVKPRPGKLPDYNNIIIMVGSDRGGMEKQAAHLQNRLNKFPGYENVKISLKTTPREEEAGGTGVNFTAMRNVLKDTTKSPSDQFAVWRKAFDPALDDNWVKYLMTVAREGMGITPNKNLEESVMSEIDLEVGDKLDRAISLYKKGRIDSEVLGDFTVKLAGNVSKKLKLDRDAVQSVINDYIDNMLNDLDEEAAGVGIITKQNTTADVGPGTLGKMLRNLKLA